MCHCRKHIRNTRKRCIWNPRHCLLVGLVWDRRDAAFKKNSRECGDALNLSQTTKTTSMHLGLEILPNAIGGCTYACQDQFAEIHLVLATSNKFRSCHFRGVSISTKIGQKIIEEVPDVRRCFDGDTHVIYFESSQSAKGAKKERTSVLTCSNVPYLARNQVYIPKVSQMMRGVVESRAILRSIWRQSLDRAGIIIAEPCTAAIKDFGGMSTEVQIFAHVPLKCCRSLRELEAYRLQGILNPALNLLVIRT